jgi:hypothetical protein
MDDHTQAPLGCGTSRGRLSSVCPVLSLALTSEHCWLLAASCGRVAARPLFLSLLNRCFRDYPQQPARFAVAGFLMLA